jgi:hypothetical protein
MKIGLLPLDERPVNTRYPQMVAAIAGAQALLPPKEALSHFRQPAKSAALEDWLSRISPQLDALIASFEMLGYGGLIASRTTNDTPAVVLRRLEALGRLRSSFAMPVVGFNLITRVSNANSAIEEPLYWAEEGERFYRYSQLLDMREQGLEASEELIALEAELPEAHRQDFLGRRMRNHTVNLAALQMLARQELSLLVMSSDDTSPYGLPSNEKRALSAWAGRLGLGEQLMMYPGADEVGTALTMRMVHQEMGIEPTVAAFYALPGGETVTAPYEDGPVSVTIERQIRAVGGKPVPATMEADVWLAVNPPALRHSEWQPETAAQERLERLPYLNAMADAINQRLAAGQAVVVADVAYPNGADPALIEVLFERVQIAQLAAYGAWNTAGNTIGVALAQGCAARLATTNEQKQAQKRFLLHRFLEDWGYQQVTRREARNWLQETSGKREIEPENEAAAVEFISLRLQRCLSQIPCFGGMGIMPGSVWLPWKRLFEVDFEIADTNPRM